METIRLRKHVGRDGLLKIEMPIGEQDVDCDVVITYHIEKHEKPSDWATFINETYGSLAHDPIERGPQGEYEVRDELE